MPIISSFSNKAFGGSRILSSNSALNPQYTPSIDYVLVGGGGGGGFVGGGGGGGGQVRFGSGYPVTKGTVISIVLGGGGAGAYGGDPDGRGQNGDPSTISGPALTPVTSVGGGGGGGAPPFSGKGADGGNGGGGGRDNVQPDINNRGFADGGQQSGPVWGKNGGRGAPANPTQPANNSGSGGGGGANATGGDGSNNSPNGADERGGNGGDGIPITGVMSSYDTSYRPPITKPYPNAPSHPVYSPSGPLGISSDIFAAGGGGGIAGYGQNGGNGGSGGGGSGYPHTGGDGGNSPSPVRRANSAVQFSGAGGGGGGVGPGPSGIDPWRDAGGGAGGRCIIRWNVEQFANATSTSGTVYFHEANGYRHFDFTGSGSLTI